ncbi:MAG TPA: CHAD domain-containing protein [Anaerolineales bacterium]|nr:CHAD domain-containing protein [Anaerolineales bacterium]
MSDAAGTRFLDTLAGRCDHYRSQFQAARDAITEDSIHDLRVAARRLLAMLDILRTVDSAAPVKKLHRFLKDQLDELDDLRDAQVMLLEMDRILDNIPQLAPIQIYEFQLHLEGGKADFMRRAAKDLGDSKPSDLEAHFQRLREVAEAHIRDELLCDKLLQAVDQSQARVVSSLGNVDAARPDTIHRVRIAFKNFRYMIEMVHPFLSSYPERLLRSMHAYQDAMGSIHDTTVFLDRLKEFEAGLLEHPADQSHDFDPKKIEAYYRKRLARLIRDYLACKDGFYAFWRSSPDQPFPWQKAPRRAARN